MNSLYKLTSVHTWNLIYDGNTPEIDARVELINWENPDINEYLKIYKIIGDDWGWTGRLLLSKPELKEILNSQKNEIWLFKIKGELKGYFEINRSVKGKAEIVYLGLLPDEIGKGYGKTLLKAAILCACKYNDKVWLHTCEFDHPNALSVYLKAGFIVESETMEEEYYPLDFIAKRTKQKRTTE